MLCLCASCSSTPNKSVDTGPTPAATSSSASGSFSLGQIAIKEGNYRQAIEHFSQLRQRNPNDSAAPQALLGTGYSYYKLGNNNAAVDTSNAFIQTYQNHPLVDYAYYLRGLARYGEGIIQLDDQQLKPGARSTTARKAFEYFAELVRRFPNSKYKQDSRVRMEVLHSKLAEHELGLARKALSLNRYEEAIARSEYIVNNYKKAEVTPDAYSVLIDALSALGDTDQAAKVKSVLTRDYPDYRYNSSSSSRTKVTRVDPDQLKQQKKRSTSPVNISAFNQPELSPPLTQSNTQREASPKPKLITPNTADPSVLSAIINGDGVKREEWYLAQPGNHYTLQLLGTNNERSLMQYIDDNEISDKAGYFLSTNKGENWYTLTYGLYKSRNDALLAIEDLSPVLRGPKPWVRPLSDIQDKLTQR